MTAPDATLRFREEQRFRQPWLWALLVGSLGVVLLAAAMADGDPGDWDAEDRIGIAIGGAVTAALLALFVALRMVTEVRDDGVHVRFRPFVDRRIPFDEIASVEARAYRPIREYGGWGIRWGPGGQAYNVSGNRGVQLTLENGKRLLIGSQRTSELAAEIEAARSQA